MVLSYYLYKCPYKFIWQLVKALNKNPELVAYCADPLDYVTLKPVLKYLPSVSMVVKNKKTAQFLKERGIDIKRLPCFPRAVMMCRHAAHKFPEDKIIKIGFRHGAYHFKTFAGNQYYNAFDIYFVTSEREAAQAKSRGITTAKAIGFPKLDPAFDGTYDETKLDSYRYRAGINVRKKTIIFSATWDRSGMSAIDIWIDKIHQLMSEYNILVTVHPWMSRKYIKKLASMQNIYFIQEPDVLPYLMIADLLVGDTSSIIAEFCTLDKPIITFKVRETKRTLLEIIQLLDDISIRVDNFDQLVPAIKMGLENPKERSVQRQRANQMMFDLLDGHAGERAAQIIKELIQDHQ